MDISHSSGRASWVHWAVKLHGASCEDFIGFLTWKGFQNGEVVKNKRCCGDFAYSDSFWFKSRCWAGNVRVQPGHKAPLPVSPGLHPSVCAMCGDTDVPSCNYFNKWDLSPDLFLFSFVLSHFNFMLSPISAKQEPLLIFRPQELKLFLSLWLSLPLSLSNSTSLCHIWRQITGSLKKMMVWTQVPLKWCVQPAFCLLGAEGHRWTAESVC